MAYSFSTTILFSQVDSVDKTTDSVGNTTEETNLNVPKVEENNSENNEGNNGETPVEAKLSYSVSNDLRAGFGSQFDVDNNESKKEYLENIFDTKFNYGNFNFGFRAEVDKPREQGRDTLGISNYYLEYTKENVRLRAGNFYNLIGRGLVMNTYESRPVGFNTQTQGVKADYEDEKLNASLFGGILNYAPITSNVIIQDFLIRGVSGEYRLMNELSFGGSFLAVSGLKNKFLQNPFETYLREVYSKFGYGNMTGFVNYAYKNTPLDSQQIVDLNSTSNGYGLYGMLGYNDENLGLNFEYKDYSFDIVHPDLQQNPPNATKGLPMQQPPTLMPEHDKALLARNPHQQEINDEVGIMITGNYNASDNLTFGAVYSAGSRHFAYQFLNDSLSKILTSPKIFPELSDTMYSPYSEIFISAEYKASDKLSFTGGVQLKKNYIFTEAGVGHAAKTEKNDALTIMISSFIEIGEVSELHAILEIQKAYNSKKKTPADTVLNLVEFDGNSNNIYTVLEYTLNDKFAINSRVEFSTVKNEQNQRTLWPVLGGTYRIGNSHTFGLQYGSERGGVVCTGGVCRTVNPFTGFRVSLSSKF